MASPHIDLRNDQFSQITLQPIARLQIQDKKVILITSLGRLIKTEPWNFHPSLWSKVELINRMRWHVVQWDDEGYQVKWSLRILGGGADQSKIKETRKAALVKELGLSEHAAELFYEHLYILSKPSDPKKFSDRIITACSTEYFIEHPDDQVLVLKILIEKFGADPNHEDEIFTSGMQRLLKYCKHKEPVEYMINHGALLKEEFAPLHRALKMGWLDTFQLMLQRGANVNECKFKATYTVYGKRILHSIVKKGSVEFLKTLLACPNIEPNPIDEEGCTPLILACEKEERHVHLLLLLSLSVDFRVCDEADRTALVALVESSSPEGFQKALDLLHKHGFKLNDVVIGSITQISYCLIHFVFSDLREHENSPWKNNSIMKNIEIMLKQKEVIEQLPFEIYMVLPSAIHTMVQAALVADKRDLQKSSRSLNLMVGMLKRFGNNL